MSDPEGPLIRATVVVEYRAPEADSDVDRECSDYINGEFEIVTENPAYPEFDIVAVAFEAAEEGPSGPAIYYSGLPESPDGKSRKDLISELIDHRAIVAAARAWGAAEAERSEALALCERLWGAPRKGGKTNAYESYKAADEALKAASEALHAALAGRTEGEQPDE